MKNSSLRDFYDSEASTYLNPRKLSYPEFLKQKLIEENAQPDFVCLDLGAATGLHALPLAQSTQMVVGLDFSGKMLRIARKNWENRSKNNFYLVQGQGEAIPLRRGNFDLVYSFSTLIFLLNFDQGLKEIYRVLKPSGLAILDISGANNLSRLHWTRFYRRLGHLHLNYFSFEGAKNAISQQGFEILQIHATGLLDQWKYVPLLRYVRPLDRIFHSYNGKADLDYKTSKHFPGFANRWYFVMRKKVIGKNPKLFSPEA